MAPEASKIKMEVKQEQHTSTIKNKLGAIPDGRLCKCCQRPDTSEDHMFPGYWGYQQVQGEDGQWKNAGMVCFYCRRVYQANYELKEPWALTSSPETPLVREICAFPTRHHLVLSARLVSLTLDVFAFARWPLPGRDQDDQAPDHAPREGCRIQ